MAEDAHLQQIHWTPHLEQFMADTGEKAYCFSWLHKKAEAIVSQKTIIIDLPVIILGVLNGATSIGSRSMFGDSSFAPIGIGIVALLTSILNTVGSYFGLARRAEAHKISSIQYAKLYRFLKIEMGLPRSERMLPADLLKVVREQIDRLAEISPAIPDAVISEFKTKFSSAEYKDIARPEICNGLERVSVHATAEAHPSDVASEAPLAIVS